MGKTVNEYYMPLCPGCRFILQNRGYDVVRKAAYSQETCAICGAIGPYGKTYVYGTGLTQEPLIRREGG